VTTLPIDKIILGDCTEILKTIPENSVDLIFADPPYNLQLSQALYRPNTSKVDAVDDGWDKFTSFEAYDTFSLDWLTGCQRVLKKTGSLWVIGTYHNIYRIGKILQDLNFWILNDVIWIKDNPMPNFRGVRFTNAHETLIWAQKKKGAKYTFNYHAMKALNDDIQMRSDWYLPLCTGNERRKVNGEKAHTTQKPESLLYRLILASTNSNDVVLDPFFGTGTTGAVAKKLGRHFIGIELDSAYIKIAEERITSIKSTPETVLVRPEPRSWPRIPFRKLLEAGLLQPGQTLTFAKDKTATAIILSNGHIQYGDITGSIHSVAKSLLPGSPANGWHLWLFDENGSRLPIDLLRQKFLHRQK
jgi:DNA modification methylase